MGDDSFADASDGISGALKFKSKLKQNTKKRRDKKLADHGLGLAQKDDDAGDPRGFVCSVCYAATFCPVCCALLMTVCVLWRRQRDRAFRRA